MVQETFSGVELLALYGDDGDERITGDDELLGFSLRRGLKKAVRYTPHYQAYRGAKWGAKKAGRFLRKLRGDDGIDYYMGEEDSSVYTVGDDGEMILLGDAEELGAFLPGLKKGLRKVGRVTSGLTTGIARTIGIPQSVIDAASKLDPTRKGTTARGAVAAITPQPQKPVQRTSKAAFKLDAKNIAIVAGAGAAGLIVLKVLLSSKK